MYCFSDETRRAYEAMTLPIAYFDNDGGKPVAILVSDGLCKMMKTDRERLIPLLNDSLLERVHPDDAARLRHAVSDFARKVAGYDVIYRSKYAYDEEYHFVHSIGRWQTQPDGTELGLFAYTDITESEGESKLLFESYEIYQKDKFYSDQLTGLPNLNFLHEFAQDKVDSLFKRGKIPALAYVDVVGLSSYNNRYGYARGDELLRLVSGALASAFPEGLIIRITDDHFAVLTEYSDALPAAFDAVNEKIREAASGTTHGIQAGICQYEEGMSTEDAIDHARRALKLIQTDLNVCTSLYSPEAEDEYWDRRYILETFDQALAENWIRVYYQGIRRLKTGNLCALEALARWVDPVRGLITPAQFIPVLKKYHLLHKLDLYMVEQVCREIPLRAEAGLPLVPVTINFSAQDFDYVDVTAEMNRILEKYGESRDLFVVEITEQDIAEGQEPFKRQLHELKQNGYHLWLDDFGSGYSSLNVLSQYEFTMIKFDMELLRNYDKPANRHIMEAMVNLARKLGIQTLAEGVETEDQQAFLQKIGCALAQGFYITKPRSLADTIYRIRSGSKPAGRCETSEERVRYSREWLQNVD